MAAVQQTYRARVSQRTLALTDCIVLLALAIAVRCVGLGDRNLWIDELFTVFWSRLPVEYLLGGGVKIETNPPLYYVFMHFWMQSFGFNEFWIRLPSVLFSASTVLTIYVLARGLADRLTALLAALLAIFDPALIYFAQEARAYALVALLDAFALIALYRYKTRLDAEGSRSWVWLALFAAASIASIATHYTSLIFVMACFAAIALDLVLRGPFALREGLVWAATAGVIGAAVAGPVVWARSLATSASISWIQPLRSSDIIAFFTNVALFQDMHLKWGAGPAVALLIGICALAAPWLNRRSFGVLIVIPVLFCAMLIFMSIWRPMLLPRVGAWLPVPMCVLLARTATARPIGWRGVASLGLCGLAFAYALQSYAGRPREDWRGAARMVARNAGCDGPIVFGRESGLGLIYYEPSLKSRAIWMAREYPDDAYTASYALAVKVINPGLIDIADVGDFARAHAHVALVMKTSDVRTTTPLPPATARVTFEGDIFVTCFQ